MSRRASFPMLNRLLSFIRSEMRTLTGRRITLRGSSLSNGAETKWKHLDGELGREKSAASPTDGDKYSHRSRDPKKAPQY